MLADLADFISAVTPSKKFYSWSGKDHTDRRGFGADNTLNLSFRVIAYALCLLKSILFACWATSDLAHISWVILLL